jgi:predicted nuclease with TOPRIM domain
MLELEERVDSLEAIFGRFIINNDKTLRRLEQMMTDMRQQADQDREQTKQMLAEMRQQSEQDRRELNQKWGELANRLGTVAEDIVAPNLPRIAREQFGCPNAPDDFMVRRWVRHKVDNSKRRDFDVVVVYPEKVFINETKATPRLNYIDDFIAVITDIHGYFPEYQGKTIIPIFAGLFML